MFEQDGADEPDDGVLVGEDAYDLGPALHLTIDPLDRIIAVKLGPMLLWETHIGEDIVLGLVHDGGELGHPRADLIGNGAPLGAGRLRGLLGEGRGDEGAGDAAAALAGMSKDVCA